MNDMRNMKLTKDEVKEYWSKVMTNMIKGDTIGKDYIIGCHLFRNMELLLDVQIGTELELFDTAIDEFVIGTVTEIKKCRWHYKDESISNACFICPGKFKLHCTDQADCHVNSPFTYIKRIIGKQFFDEGEFEI
jgi:hypothetical protein